MSSTRTGGVRGTVLVTRAAVGLARTLSTEATVRVVTFDLGVAVTLRVTVAAGDFERVTVERTFVSDSGLADVVAARVCLLTDRVSFCVTG